MLNRSKKFLACPPSHTHHFLNGREALAGSARASSPAPKQMDSLNLVDQLSQLLAGIKHAGLHGGGGNAEDVSGVLHRLLVIIGKVNDLVVLGGELVIAWRSSSLRPFL